MIIFNKMVLREGKNMTKEQLLKNLRPPVGRADVILDTDTYNEIDDQFALAYLLKSTDKLNPVGICAAPFFNGRSSSPLDGMLKSYDEILKLLELCGRNDLKNIVFKGSGEYLPDENTPVKSDAADFMAELADSYSPEKPLYIVAIGAITNVASAFLINPKMAENTVVIWLAGKAHHIGSCEEFNLSQDYAAARVIMKSGVPFVQLPCRGVVDKFITCKCELEHYFIGKNGLATYLAENTISYCERKQKDYPWTKVIWDVTAVAWLLNDDGAFMNDRIEEVRLPNSSDIYEPPTKGSSMAYVYHICRDSLFADMITKIAGTEF